VRAFGLSPAIIRGIRISLALRDAIFPISSIAFLITFNELARVPVPDASRLRRLLGYHSFNLIQVHLNMMVIVIVHHVRFLLH
jgi:hypothetical protein